MMEQARGFLACAMELAHANLEGGGRPFGAVLVKDGKVIAKAANEIVQSHDPTAHAEMLAIRRASQTLGSANLEGCIMYASGQPCPMCMGAMRLAGRESMYADWQHQQHIGH
ncbi:MAG: nucleoside deaminase [Corticimicrobacter sp.]|uniref:nucleoside deaminase n=1 Tax=Corticimicrobacter sp. TaxID=2678536 RepID=UPI0032DA9F81